MIELGTHNLLPILTGIYRSDPDAKTASQASPRLFNSRIDLSRRRTPSPQYELDKFRWNGYKLLSALCRIGCEMRERGLHIYFTASKAESSIFCSALAYHIIAPSRVHCNGCAFAYSVLAFLNDSIASLAFPLRRLSLANSTPCFSSRA